METSQIYILISILVLIIIFIFLILVRKNRKQKNVATPLTGLAFGFILAGIVFGGDSRLISYGLMGIGLLFAFIDMFRKLKKR